MRRRSLRTADTRWLLPPRQFIVRKVRTQGRFTNLQSVNFPKQQPSYDLSGPQPLRVLMQIDEPYWLYLNKTHCCGSNPSIKQKICGSSSLLHCHSMWIPDVEFTQVCTPDWSWCLLLFFYPCVPPPGHLSRGPTRAAALWCVPLRFGADRGSMKRLIALSNSVAQHTFVISPKLHSKSSFKMCLRCHTTPWTQLACGFECITVKLIFWEVTICLMVYCSIDKWGRE